MTMTIPSLASLDPAAVQANLLLTVQRLQEANPTLDCKRGVLHDLLAYYHAALGTALQTNLERYLSARSLADILADPTLADPGVVDGILANWGLSRTSGAAAQGEVTLILHDPVSVTIGSGTVFTANGQEFRADATYTAKPEAAQINASTDRLLLALADGTWAFTIHVTAAATGASGVITKDTLLVPAALPTAYVTSYAANDFTGGLDPETNEALLRRLQQGLAARAPSNRVNLQALLRQAFPGTLQSSVVGFGDVEQLRDQHQIWPGPLGGCADWYIRTQERAAMVGLTKSATLLAKDAAGGTWQLALGRDDMPGFYEIVSVRPASADVSAGTFAILADVRGLDTTGSGFVPDLASVAEGAYTRYQTAVVQFRDNRTDYTALAVGATQEYAVAVRGLPLLAEIQDYMGSFETRSYGADVLIKAPLPCFVQLSLVIAKRATAADPDLAAIREALAAAVNRNDFTGRLYAGELQDVIHGYLPTSMQVGAIDMFGRLRRPDGAAEYLRSSEVLIVPTLPGTMVSPRTVQFFLDPTDIAIDVRAEVLVPA